MRKFVAAATLATLFTVSANAAEIYKDYTVGKEVLNVTFINVKPNRFDDYLDGLRQTWLPGCEIGKKMGTVVRCGIYSSTTSANRDFNLILVMVTPSAAVADPDEARYNQFMTEMRAKLAQDKQDKIVEGYDEMRSFFGEQDFREITFK